MPGISDTAYPRLKPNPSAQELDEVYTPNLFEGSWVEQRTREPVPRTGLLVLLKTFQRLGYFVMMDEVPKPILQHIAACAGYDAVPAGLAEYDASSVRRRHMALVRDYVGVSAWCEVAQTVMIDACRQAARTRDDLADIVNIALEELVRQRYELPAFNTVLRAARAARTEINQGYYAQVPAYFQSLEKVPPGALAQDTGAGRERVAARCAIENRASGTHHACRRRGCICRGRVFLRANRQ
jgi:hypothetical protein